MDLATENGFGGLPDLAGLYGVRGRRLIQVNPESGWKAILSGEPIEFLTTQGRVRDARSIYCRVCTRCFADDKKPYHRSEWDLPLSLVCKIHSTLLLDSCGTCGRPIDYLRKRIAYCPCGVPFNVAPQDAPPWVKDMVSYFVNLEDPSRRESFAWSTIDEMQGARVLIRIADHQAGRTTIYAGGTRVVEPIVRQSHLKDLEPWFEKGASSFLARMRELGGEEEGWARYRMNLKLHRFPSLSRVLANFFKEKPLRLRRAERNGQAEVIYRASDLRVYFRMNAETIVHWVSAGILPQDTFVPGQRSRVPASAYEKVKSMFEGSCLQNEASEIMGSTKEVVRKLILLGGLKRMNLLPSVAWDRVDLQSLFELNCSFLAHGVHAPVRGSHISFEKIVQTIHTAEGWKAFELSIEAGVNVYFRGNRAPRLADLKFSLEELATAGVHG